MTTAGSPTVACNPLRVGRLGDENRGSTTSSGDDAIGDGVEEAVPSVPFYHQHVESAPPARVPTTAPLTGMHVENHATNVDGPGKISIASTTTTFKTTPTMMLLLPTVQPVAAMLATEDSSEPPSPHQATPVGQQQQQSSRQSNFQSFSTIAPHHDVVTDRTTLHRDGTSHPRKTATTHHQHDVSLSACDVLMSPLHWLYNFVFVDNIVPTDDFFMRVRKASVGGLLIAFLGQCINIVELWTSSSLATSLFALFAIFIPMTVTHVFGFVYCKVTKETPDWLFGTMMITATVCRCLLATTTRTYDMGAASFGFVMVTLCSRMPVAVVVTVILLSLVCLSINTVNLEGTSQLLMFPGSSMKTVDLMKHLIGSRLAFFVTSIIFFIMVQHFYTILSAKDSAVKLSRELAERLQKYDTAGAWEILRRDDAAAQVDPDLLTAFEGIIDNLEHYRPFLPNYLLFDPSGKGLDTSVLQSDALLSTAGIPMSSVARSGGGGGGGSAGERSSTASRSTEVRSMSISGPLGSAPRQSDSFSAIATRIRPQGASGDMQPVASFGERSLHPVASSPCMVAVSSVVAACVMSVHRTVTTGVEFGIAGLWSAFIAAVNDAAQSTGASLHSFVGDRLIATWNATKRCSKPETRACQFSLRVRAAVEANSMLHMAFSLSSMVGTRQAESCFAGDSRLRLFACSSPELWRHIDSGLNRVDQLRLSVVDYATKVSAVYEVIFRAAGLLMNGPLSGTDCLQRRCLYEIVQERIADPRTDQEWMYALQQHAKDPNEQLIQVMEQCAVGNLGSGIETLRRLQEEHPESFAFAAASDLLRDLRGDEVTTSEPLIPVTITRTQEETAAPSSLQ